MSDEDPLNARLARLTSHFRAVGEAHVRGLPIFNERLAVEAVGFRPLRRYWVGALITPWFLNVFLLPRAPETEPPREEGARVGVTLPGGRREFLAGADPELGPYLSHSLVSPMGAFADQAAARAYAELALERLLEAPPEPPAGSGPGGPGNRGRRRFLRTVSGRRG